MYSYQKVDPEKCEFIPVAAIGDVPVGERLFLTIDHLSIVIFNIAGIFFAIEDVCSHDGNPLDDAIVNQYEIICQRHGGSFDVRNGKAISMPAVMPIASYPTRVVNGQVEIGLPLN